jgi:hypothetical protein
MELGCCHGARWADRRPGRAWARPAPPAFLSFHPTSSTLHNPTPAAPLASVFSLHRRPKAKERKTRLPLDPRPAQTPPTTRYYELGRSRADSQAFVQPNHQARSSTETAPFVATVTDSSVGMSPTRIACPAVAHKTAEGVRIASHRIARLRASHRLLPVSSLRFLSPSSLVLLATPSRPPAHSPSTAVLPAPSVALSASRLTARRFAHSPAPAKQAPLF